MAAKSTPWPLTPRAVVVHRRTELDELLGRHGTRQQAAFFLSTRGRSLDEVELRHAAQQAALQAVSSSIPLEWRRGMVERADLDRFVFGPEDVIVAVGQDGLVANVAKYLSEQIVVGLNPEPERNPGGAELTITAESDLVVFGDGIESDSLHLGWGQRIILRPAEQRLHLLV